MSDKEILQQVLDLLKEVGKYPWPDDEPDKEWELLHRITLLAADKCDFEVHDPSGDRVSLYDFKEYQDD